MFTVTVQVVEMKLEEDRDIHLVIAEPSDPSATMISEFPDADQCTGAVASSHAQEMRTARGLLVAAFGQPSSSQFTNLTGTATLTGVGFFDFLHGQTGVAPNGIELQLPFLGPGPLRNAYGQPYCGVDSRLFRIHDGRVACAGFGKETSVMADELTPAELDRFSHTMAREVAKLIYRVGTVRDGDSQRDLVVRKAVLVEALADYFFFEEEGDQERFVRACNGDEDAWL